MKEKNIDKQYKSFKIPNSQQVQEVRTTKAPSQTKNDEPISLYNDSFYEIEYDSCPIEGVGKFVLKSQKIEPPKKDEVRELFSKMRDIARRYPLPFTNYSKFSNMTIRQNNAKIFYKQAMFMKDFEDDYEDKAPFSAYFPYYQMLGYEQLRTYFTWRTCVRKGIVNNIYLSYVFLYIYELINNIGVDSPQDGLDKLMSFWTSFKRYDKSIDKYVLRWLKDYHIYYNLPQPFKDFAKEHGLTEYYSKMIDSKDSFDLFCSISKYDIRKSVFFTDETRKLITDCFYFVLKKIRQNFETVGIHFDNFLFYPTKKVVVWRPFKDALFYSWLKQPNRSVVISENEIYICKKNEWIFSTVITTEKGKKIIGYMLKQMESVLRTVTKYKFKITANINMIDKETLNKLKKSGLCIEKIVQEAVIEFYKEETKIIVTVDHTALSQIRQEALVTQKSLIVDEETAKNDSGSDTADLPLQNQNIFVDILDTKPESVCDSWENLKENLNKNELLALSLILQGENIKEFADNINIMLEVLIDGINEKAIDYIGDNLISDELTIYEDYEEEVKGVIESL